MLNHCFPGSASAKWIFRREILDVRGESGAKGAGIEAGEREERHVALSNVAAQRCSTTEANSTGN